MPVSGNQQDMAGQQPMSDMAFPQYSQAPSGGNLIAPNMFANGDLNMAVVQNITNAMVQNIHHNVMQNVMHCMSQNGTDCPMMPMNSNQQNMPNMSSNPHNMPNCPPMFSGSNPNLYPHLNGIPIGPKLDSNGAPMQPSPGPMGNQNVGWT